MLVNKKPGSSLINCILAVFIFSMVFICIACFYGVQVRYMEKEKQMLKATCVLEYLRNDIMCNWSYDDLIKSFCNKDIDISQTGIEELSNFTDCHEILNSDSLGKGEYIHVEAIEDNENGIIDFKMYYHYDEQVIQCCFCRGNYEKT